MEHYISYLQLVKNKQENQQQMTGCTDVEVPAFPGYTVKQGATGRGPSMPKELCQSLITSQQHLEETYFALKQVFC